MKVKQLRSLLAQAGDDAPVLVYLGEQHLRVRAASLAGNFLQPVVLEVEVPEPEPEPEQVTP